jgi:phosphoribosylaminoimidazolecarboxamide formyltransferase/IMP cyclohydrolase
VQQTDLINAEGDDPKNWKQVTGAPVSAAVMKDLAFAWRAVRAVKSNAILLAKDGAAVGIENGASQSRRFCKVSSRSCW